jgi:ParB-like chromosome segregation protein Spo0J
MSENWPARQVEMRRVSELVPNARNSRTHSEEQIAQIAGLMKAYGWTVPVLVDEEGVIIAGHGRITAARMLGLSEVPVMVARGWSDAQKRAYMIADNAIAEKAGWNPEMLKLELQDLADADFRMELTGFDAGELSMRMYEPDFHPAGEDSQSRLDEKKKVRCPECDHEFAP